MDESWPLCDDRVNKHETDVGGFCDNGYKKKWISHDYW